MKNEADFKSAIKKSIRAQKGFSLSLAAPTLPGTPDLYAIMPGFAPVLLEAKYLGIVGTKFKRKIQYTDMQRYYLKEISSIKEGLALGLIGFKYQQIYHAVLLSPEIEHITDKDFAFYPWTSAERGIFNILDLFQSSNIPKLNGYHGSIQSFQLPPRPSQGIA